MTLQPQQSAELLRPCRQAILLDAGQCRRVVGQGCHSHLHDRPPMASVSEVRGPSAQQAGNDAFDHRSAVATSTGEMDLVRGALSVQPCLLQHPQHVLRGRRGRERLDGVRDAHRENPSGMQRRTQGGIVERQVASHRVDGGGAPTRDLRHGVLDFVDQGQHEAGITRIADRELHGKDEARGWLDDNPWLAAKLSGTVALPFANRSNGQIVGIDDFAMGQRLAIGQPAGLFFDVLMGRYGSCELRVQTLTLPLRQVRAAVQALLRCLGQRKNLMPNFQQVLLGLAYQRHKHLALPAALPAEAAHDLGEVVLELLRLGLQRRALGGALVGEVLDDLENFFLALYSVAASLTRWLPCSLGKVSTTRCAGLTRPASMAAVAWTARSSSIKAASIRLRNCASTSGSTKCSWEAATWTSAIPQAYMTAKSVRRRLQTCSSEQCNSCFSNSNANNTRGATAARPRAVGWGNRCAKLRSTAATKAAQGNVSAHCRSGWVAGTKSATRMCGPPPLSQC